MKILPISHEDIKPWLLEKHYAHRLPSMTYKFGVFINGVCEGVVAYGTPSSSPLRKGVCGTERADKVLELNRLCINSTAPKNTASFLIGRTLRMLPKDAIIVSYSDTSVGHVGYVYQATNWVYTGLSAKRTDWKIRGLEHLHGATIADMSRGQKNRAAWMREKFGDDFYLQERPRKHRYVFFRNKKDRVLLRYKVEPYPKGDSKKYKCVDI